MVWEKSNFICNCREGLDTVFINTKSENKYEAGNKVRCINCGRTGIIDDDQESCWINWDY